MTETLNISKTLKTQGRHRKRESLKWEKFKFMSDGKTETFGSKEKNKNKCQI